KIKEKDMEDVDEEKLQDLRATTREFVSRIGEDLREAEEDVDEEVAVGVDDEAAPGDIDIEDYEKAKESADRTPDKE
ncbi:MAG: hypothetical protein SVW77_03705, partial [Candidatus Nanohaloarchaea archaeon]|nr:hypothetical protein [Candidatus Nanohaloarchaea archaeon]